MQSFVCSLICTLVLFTAPAFAQDKSADLNMRTLREELRADKKAVVAANMQLSDTEASAFWPIYDQYQHDLSVINERLVKAINAYADAYSAGPVTSATAKNLIEESIAIDEAELRLRRDYAVKLTRVIPPAKAARYLQIESKIRAVIRYELAANIPLVD